MKKVCSLKISEDEFLFVFAKDQDQVETFVKKEWEIKPLNCHEYSLDMEIIYGKECISLRKMKRGFLTFLVLIGCFKKESFLSIIEVI